MKNIFGRSTLRQPVKTALLVILIGLITFVFISRVMEYLLIRQEIERLGSFYRSIGTVEPSGGAVQYDSIIKYLHESPYVKMADQACFGSGIMQEVYNADAEEIDADRYLREDVFFCGILTQVHASSVPDGNGGRKPTYRFYFTVDEVLAGYPEAIQVGDKVSLVNASEQKLLGISYIDMTGISEEMEVGQRYLVRGEYACYNTQSHLRSSSDGGVFVFKKLSDSDPWYFRIEEDRNLDFSDPHLAGVAKQIRLFDDNQHAVNSISSDDVSALAAVMQNNWAPYLVDGRWPDSQDNDTGRRVCAIHEQLALKRGLSVGDTLSLTLRDLVYPYGFLFMGEDLTRLDSITVSESETYEIVGIYNATQAYIGRCIFIPSSARPDTFCYGLRPGAEDIHFELISPAIEAQFVVEATNTLASYGVQPVMIESGWANFQAATTPMRQSALFNVISFSVLLLVTLSLITFVYCRMRYRDIAIARALGVPVRKCVWEASLPLLLNGMLGILFGGTLGWRYTLKNAGETLRSLAEFGGKEYAVLPQYWLILLCGAVFVLLVLLAAGSVLRLAQKPVMLLIQGQTAKKTAKAAKANSKQLTTHETGQPISAVPLRFHVTEIPTPVKSTGTAHILQFIWQHITRANMKSILSILLATAFTVGLAVIQLSIADSGKQVNRLYDTTTVNLDIVQDGTQTNIPRSSVQGDGYINIAIIDALRDTGFIADAYLVGGNSATVIPYEGEWSPGQGVSFNGEGLTRTAIRSFNNLVVYKEKSGSDISITYLDGWDESLFGRDWKSGAEEDISLFPVVLPQYLYKDYGLKLGDTIGISCNGFCLCLVAGFYSGIVEDSELGTPLLMPDSAVEVMAGGRMLYAQAQLSLDPARNREIDQFRTALNSIIDGTKNRMALRALLWDEELRLAVEPLEDSIILMKLLYPIVFILSLLTAAGIAALFVMTSSKEAAIMRILGTTKRRSAAMLALQNVLTSLAGLLLGLMGVFTCMGSIEPGLLASLAWTSVVCALLYLLATVVSAGVSSMVVTSRNPLELLQVKE